MKHTIATTEIGDYFYEDYLEWCEINHKAPDSEDSDDFFDWRCDETSIDYEEDMANIRHFAPYDVPVIITGRLGLWWGHPEIEPVQEKSVYDAIVRCGESADDIVADWEDGEVVVYAKDHDGTSIFTIKAVDGKLPYLYA